MMFAKFASAFLLVAALAYSAEASATCSDVQALYQNQACCGASGGKAVCVNGDSVDIKAKLDTLLSRVAEPTCDQSGQGADSGLKFDHIVEAQTISFAPQILEVPELSQVSFEFLTSHHNVWSDDNVAFRSIGDNTVTHPIGYSWKSPYVLADVAYSCPPHLNLGMTGEIKVTPLQDHDFAKRIFEISEEHLHQVQDTWYGLKLCAVGTGDAPASADSAKLWTLWKKIDFSVLDSDADHKVKVRAHMADLFVLMGKMLDVYKQKTGQEYAAGMLEKGSTSEVELMDQEAGSLHPYNAYHELGEGIEHVPKLLGGKLIQGKAPAAADETLAAAYGRMKTGYLNNAAKMSWAAPLAPYVRTYQDPATYGLLLDSLEDFAKGSGYSIAGRLACQDHP